MAKITCAKCGKAMEDSNFYTYRDGTKTELCKPCLTMHVNNFDPDTFLWLLKKLDVPYVEEEWNALRDKAFAKNPNKMTGMSVFGKYLSKMRLKQWKDYRWADTEKLQEDLRQRKEALTDGNQRNREEDRLTLKKQFERGEISEAEYKTLSPIELLVKDYEEDKIQQATQTVAVDGLKSTNPYNENNFIPEEDLIDLGADLTDEDKIYLAMKWGRVYKASEWVELEKKYTEMKESFDIEDSDTEGTLILICKTYLKMNQAIDMGDMDGYQKLSRVYDSLRKSAKFTAAQNKEAKADFIGSLGELVAYCEEKGGEIPRYEITTDRDIVDKVIRDLKDYTRSLVYEDTALARQIEDYIKKREIAEVMKREKEEAKKKGREVQVSDQDYIEHFHRLEEEREQDQTIYQEAGE